MNGRRRVEGFQLLELLTVMAVLGLLMGTVGVVVPMVTLQWGEASLEVQQMRVTKDWTWRWQLDLDQAVRVERQEDGWKMVVAEFDSAGVVSLYELRYRRSELCEDTRTVMWRRSVDGGEEGWWRVSQEQSLVWERSMDLLLSLDGILKADNLL